MSRDDPGAHFCVPGGRRSAQTGPDWTNKPHNNSDTNNDQTLLLLSSAAAADPADAAIADSFTVADAKTRVQSQVGQQGPRSETTSAGLGESRSLIVSDIPYPSKTTPVEEAQRPTRGQRGMTQATRDRTARNKTVALAKRAARTKPTITKPSWKISNATNSHFGMDDASTTKKKAPTATATSANNNSFLLLGRSATAATPTTEVPTTTPTSATTAAHNNTNTNTNTNIRSTNNDPILLLLCSAAAARPSDTLDIPATARPPDNGGADAPANDIITTDRPPDAIGGPPAKARKLNAAASGDISYSEAAMAFFPTALRALTLTSNSTSSSSASGSANLDFTSVGFRGLVSPPSSSVQPTWAPT